MSLVTYELDDHVATITLNRPDARNAINGALRRDLNAAWNRFRHGAGVRLCSHFWRDSPWWV